MHRIQEYPERNREISTIEVIMSDRRYFREEKPVKRTHPLWKPIGFLLMVFVPLFSFAVADIVMKWILENYEDLDFHPLLTSDPVVIWNDWVVNNVPGTIVIALLISIILFLIISLLNALIYGMNKDKNLSAFYVPPIKRKKKKKNLRDI